MAKPKDIAELNWNGHTCDSVATVGTVTAADRAGVTRPDGAYKVGVLPAGALLLGVYTNTTKLFDQAATIGVGDGTDAAKWSAVASCKAIAVVKGTKGLDKVSDVAQDIVATIAFGGSIEGQVEVTFLYVDLNHRRGMFTE